MESVENVAMCASDPHPIRSWFRRKLFPCRHVFAPAAPGDWKDCITMHTVCELSLLDRLRVLLTGRLEVTTRTITENEVGRSVTAADSYVLPWKMFE